MSQTIQRHQHVNTSLWFEVNGAWDWKEIQGFEGVWSWRDKGKGKAVDKRRQQTKQSSYPLSDLLQMMAGGKGDEGLHLQGSTA